jgi:hypothetical protein
MGRKKMTKAEKVWAYLLKNRLASPKEVSTATGVSYGYTYKLMQKIGTPREVIEAEVTQNEHPHKRTRSKTLYVATSLVEEVREEQHGDFADNAKTTAELWSAYKGVEFSALDVPMMMALLKIARVKSSPDNPDNYVDTCGYVALASEVVKES